MSNSSQTTAIHMEYFCEVVMAQSEYYNHRTLEFLKERHTREGALAGAARERTLLRPYARVLPEFGDIVFGNY